MIIFKLAFAYIFPVLLGYLLVALISSDEGKLSAPEKIAISYGIGVGILTFIMFLIGAFRLPMDLTTILVVCAILFAYPLIKVIKNMRVPNMSTVRIDLKSIKWYEWLLLALISLRIFYSYFSALIKPVEDVDAFADWGLRAKVFFFDHGLSLDRTRGYFFGGSHSDYPINIPLLQTWIFNVLGSWNDLLIKAIFPTFLLALVIVFYCSMRRISGRPFSLFSTYLLTTLPFLIYHSASAYTDFPLSFYFFSSFIYLVAFLLSGDLSFLTISSLFAGFSSWTKNEGIMFALVDAIVLVVYLYYLNKHEIKSRLETVARYIAPILALFIPWSVFKLIHSIPTSSEQTLHFSQLFKNINRIPVLLGDFYKKSFFYGHWDIAWFTFFLVLLISFFIKRSRRENLFVLLGILLCFLAYGAVYFLSDAYVWIINGTNINRNILAFMPLVMYYICSTIVEIFNDGFDSKRKNSSKP